MSNETVTIEGVAFVSPDACSFGDYSGEGSVGLANIRTIVADAGEHVVECSYSDIRLASEETGGFYVTTGETDLRAAVKDGAIVLHVWGDYASQTVYIRADSDLAKETLERLLDYPSLDDETVSLIEMEWETEAWESWLKADLIREAFQANEDEWERVEALPDEVLFAAYRDAMDSENEYPTPEHSGVHVDVDRIAKAFAANVRALTAAA